jgi:hypothetical protein
MLVFTHHSRNGREFQMQEDQLLEDSKIAMRGWDPTLSWYKIKYSEYGNHDPSILVESNPYAFDVYEYGHEISPETYRPDKYGWIPGNFTKSSYI